MSLLRRTGAAVTVAVACMLSTPASNAFAAGPQPLPAQACNEATTAAAANAPNQMAAEAIPHIEHAYPIPVPYCHHFNPTATPPTAP